MTDHLYYFIQENLAIFGVVARVLEQIPRG